MKNRRVDPLALTVFFSTMFLPFLLVWAGFILTGFSFTPSDIFQSGAFWGVSVIYWLLWVCLIGFIMEEMF